MTKEKRISLRFTDKNWAFIKHMSVDTNQSMNAIVGKLIDDMVKRHQKRLDSFPSNGKMAPQERSFEG